MMTELKTCAMCDIAKGMDEFHIDRNSKDGRQKRCKECAKRVAREWYASNREAIRERSRKAYAENPEMERRRSREWYAANRERATKRIAEYRENNAVRLAEAERKRVRENREKYRRKGLEYYRANAERLNRAAAERRAANAELSRIRGRHAAALRQARKKANKAFVVIDKDLRRILHGSCAVDGCTRSDIQIDHIIPVARGGDHGIGNLQALCSHHNRSKSAKLWVEYRVFLNQQVTIAA